MSLPSTPKPSPFGQSAVDKEKPCLFGMVTTAASRDYTELAIRSLLEYTPINETDEIIIINNDASDQPPFELLHPRITLITPPHPRGFAQNGNFFIAKALETDRDLVFVNNDLIFSRGWREALERCGPVIALPTTNREAQYALAFASPYGGVEPVTFTLSMTMDRSELDDRYYAFQAMAEFHASRCLPNHPLIVLPFSCVRLPHGIMASLGGFDESFGVAGAEDYDYCLRAYLAGFEVHLAMGSLILHFGGRSSWGIESSDQRLEREGRFRQRFKDKWGERLYAMLFLEHDVVGEDPVLRSLQRPDSIALLIRELLSRDAISTPSPYLSPRDAL